VGEAEAVARRVHEGALEIFLRGIRDGVHERVETTEVAFHAGEHAADLRFGRHVARVHERARHRGGEFLDVLLEPLALVGERQPHAGGRQRLRDRPRDGALVGDAEHDARLAVKQLHGSTSAAMIARRYTAGL
jgi:hypothetical protein